MTTGNIHDEASRDDAAAADLDRDGASGEADLDRDGAASDDAPSGEQLDERSAQPRRVDAVSLVAGVLFIVIAALALTDRHWAEIDLVSAVSAAFVVIGVLAAVGVLAGHRRERRT